MSALGLVAVYWLMMLSHASMASASNVGPIAPSGIGASLEAFAAGSPATRFPSPPLPSPCPSPPLRPPPPLQPCPSASHLPSSKPEIRSSPPSPSPRTPLSSPSPVYSPSPPSPRSPTPPFTVANSEDNGANSVDALAVLSVVNGFRARHGSPPLTWDNNLANVAQQWADNCMFAHSPLGGDSLAVSSSVFTAQALFYDEVCQYSWDQPKFSLTTGHFTQLIWASTTRTACAVGYCPNGITDNTGDVVYTRGVLTVCRYSSPGNMNTPTAFRANVPPLLPGVVSICPSPTLSGRRFLS